jgi:hypothetical protein
MTNFSIKTLLGRQQNPELFKVRSACLYLIHVAQHVNARMSNDDPHWINSYFKCTKLDKRITKKHCTGCKMYLKPNAIESKTA